MPWTAVLFIDLWPCTDMKNRRCLPTKPNRRATTEIEQIARSTYVRAIYHETFCLASPLAMASFFANVMYMRISMGVIQMDQ